jgi:benzoylformate decarboxylase
VSSEATRPVGVPASDGQAGEAPARTVRDALFDLLRERGMRTIFSNPGSTEVPLLAGLPGDLRFVLALHEGSVVGMATGAAIGSGRPAFVLLHTTAGLGNAVAALATARVNRAPLVVVVGQQDRRHLALEPFLAGRLEGLAGDYPVWVNVPARAQDVPGAVARAEHEAVTGRGPAIVVVPMDDWLAPAGEEAERPAPARVLRPAAAEPAAVEELAALLVDARAPVLVVGAGADDDDT